jgi:hypothetical protein
MSDPEAVRPYAEPAKERGCIWIHLTEDMATSIASGYVPNSVKSVLRQMLDHALEDERRVARPVPKAGRKERRRSVARGQGELKCRTGSNAEKSTS